MQVKKVLTWGGMAFVAYTCSKRPTDAATAVKGAFDNVISPADSLAQL